jgi:hypothetical protein
VTQQARSAALERITAASPPLSRQTVWDIALSAWRSPRLFVFLLLLIAIVIGAHLRFHRVGRFDMNGDEGASWVAASAPSVWQVARIERQADPGKLALYDVMLHEWIGVFGDSLFAMRAMSGSLWRLPPSVFGGSGVRGGWQSSFSWFGRLARC